MNIGEVYDKYKIPSWLREHMVKVTAVAVSIFDARGETEGRDTLIFAGLFHDLGNIVKFNFDILKPLDGSDPEYWNSVKKDFIEKYGQSAHVATIKILEEIGVKENIKYLIDTMSFTRSPQISEGDDILLKILTYADMRVLPNGVSSLGARIDDMYARYTDKHPKDSEKTKLGVEGMFDIEKQLFSGIELLPEEITEESTKNLQVEFSNFDISCSLK